MSNETKASIQNQKYRIELIVKGISAERAIQAFKDYLPSGTTQKVGEDAYCIVDHLDRRWTISGNADNSEAKYHISTPELAYEDMDEFLCLVEALKGQGMEGGEGCGMRLFVSVKDQGSQAVSNLKSIVTGKLFLLEKVLQVSLSIKEKKGESLRDDGMAEVFPYVMGADLNVEEMKAVIQLGCAVCAQAINQNRVVEKTVRPENERYYFRCWLLRAGLIGNEYKPMRMRFLKRLDGSSSYKVSKAS